MALFVFSRPANPARVSHGIRKSANLLLIAAFGVSLGLMLAGVFRGNAASDIEQWERRRPEEFPQLHYKASGFIRRPDTRSIKQFPRQFEKWFNDHIGFRRPLIQLYQTARFHGWTPSQLSITSTQDSLAAGLISHPASSEEKSKSEALRRDHQFLGSVPVVFGKDRWLYFGVPPYINEARGLNLFTADDLQRWKQGLEKRRDWLAKRGIRYVVLIAPDKATIYPEYLPDSMAKVNENSRLEQLTEYLAQESDLAVVNVVEPLRQAKSKSPLYFRTGTHWNQYGAFIAYQELMKPLSTWFPQLRVLSLEDYDVVIQDIGYMADLAVMAGSVASYREKSVLFTPRREASAGDELHQLSRIVVVHDSFIDAMSRFLTPHGREVTYVDIPWNDRVLPVEKIEQIQPELVIEEFVQRSLQETPPANPPALSEER